MRKSGRAVQGILLALAAMAPAGCNNRDFLGCGDVGLGEPRVGATYLDPGWVHDVIYAQLGDTVHLTGHYSRGDESGCNRSEYYDSKTAPSRFSWSSSNTLVAEVNAQGVLTPREPGASTIRVDAAGLFDLVVTQVMRRLEAIEFSAPSATVKVGDTITVSVSFRDTTGAMHGAITQVGGPGVPSAAFPRTSIVTTVRGETASAVNMRITGVTVGETYLIVSTHTAPSSTTLTDSIPIQVVP